MAQIKPPDPGLQQWIQLLAVQLVTIGSLLVGGWKLLTKRLRKRQDILRRRLTKLKRAFGKESFDLRTSMTTQLRKWQDLQMKVEQMIQAANEMGDSTLSELQELRKEVAEVGLELRDELSALSKRMSHMEGQMDIITGMLRQKKQN